MSKAFDVFINRERAKEIGLHIDEINSPHSIWNRKLPEGVAYVFGADTDSKLYKELDSNSEFIKKRVYSGN